MITVAITAEKFENEFYYLKTQTFVYTAYLQMLTFQVSAWLKYTFRQIICPRPLC